MDFAVSKESSFRFDRYTGVEWKEAIFRQIEQDSMPSSVSGSLYQYLQGNHPTLEGCIEYVALDPLLTIEAIRSSSCPTIDAGSANSVQEAILSLGFDRLSRIALRLWLRSLLPAHGLRVYGQGLDAFWLHSLACGAAMRFVYHGDSAQSQTAYAVGLLHSVGRIVLDRVFREFGETRPLLGRGTSRRMAEEEGRELGTNHAEVGSVALRHWGFAQEVFLPVFFQYSNRVPHGQPDWRQCLGIARFTADRVMDSLGGDQHPLRGEGRAIYKSKSLSDIFEYALASVENEGADILN